MLPPVAPFISLDEENSDDLWQQLGENIAPVDGQCGSAVDISNDGKTVIIGCPTTGFVGSAHLYQFNGSETSWDQIMEWKGENNFDNLGRAVSIATGNSNIFAFSDFGFDGSGANSFTGRIQVFRHIDGSFDLIGDPILGSEGDFLGRDIDLSSDGRRIAVGSTNFIDILDFNGTDWVNVERIDTSDVGLALKDLTLSGKGNKVGFCGTNIHRSTSGGWSKIA